MKQVLMIEDDVSLHELYKEALSKVGIGFVGAITGKDGLDMMVKNPSDLVIIDIMLPGGMNGFDVAEQLRQNPKTSSVPFIILTNLDSETESAKAVGAADYIVKTNTSLNEVVEKITSLIGATPDPS